MKDYLEPEVTFAILDFQKPQETKHCISSIRNQVKFPYRIAYLHNGKSDYAYELYRAGLIDTFIQSKENNGLGVGTRDLMASVFTPYTIYFQNDQVVGRAFEKEEFEFLKLLVEQDNVKSVALAGPTAGADIYSERAHIIKTDFYRLMEFSIPLGPYGAGPYHHGPWREEQIQKYYKENSYLHFTGHPPLAVDIGKWTIRDCAGGRVRMRTDTKAVTWEIAPTEKYVFPEHTDEEWELAIAGKWPVGKIPQIYIDKKLSFSCWDNLNL